MTKYYNKCVADHRNAKNEQDILEHRDQKRQLRAATETRGYWPDRDWWNYAESWFMMMEAIK